MSDTLKRIKRAVLAGNVVFTDKATTERDHLREGDVIESILNAVAIYKTLKSTRSAGRGREYLHVIQATNLDGLAIYSKGKLVVSGGSETYYILNIGQARRIANASDQDLSNLRQQTHRQGATNARPLVPRATIRSPRPNLLRMSQLWRTTLRPRGFAEDRRTLARFRQTPAAA